MVTSPIAQKVSSKVDQLLKKVDRLLKQQKTIEKKEQVILQQVAVEEKEDEVVEEKVEKVEEISNIQEAIINKTKRHRLFFPLIVAAGVILVWRGLWTLFDQVPILSYSFISLALGIIILWAFNRMNSL